MNKTLLRPTIALLISLGSFSAPVLALAREMMPAPLLDYPFSEGAGVRASDHGPLALNLELGPAWSWGVPGSGVRGGPTLGRIGARDIFIENKTASHRGLDKLRSFTICGWYKLGFNEQNTGVLFELSASDGNGFQLHFSSKPEEGGDRKNGPWRHALVAMIGLDGTNPHTGEGVRYSSWQNPCALLGEWIFFAVTVDTTRTNNAYLHFYAASENGSLENIGRQVRKPDDTRDLSLGKIEAIRIGNSTDLKMPLPVGTYIDGFRFYGSAKDNTGALSKETLENIRKNAVEKQL